MAYLALLAPALALAGLPLIDRLERWALSPDRPVASAEPADTRLSAPISSGGELG
jgi:hypothetical protein